MFACRPKSHKQTKSLVRMYTVYLYTVYMCTSRLYVCILCTCTQYTCVQVACTYRLLVDGIIRHNEASRAAVTSRTSRTVYSFSARTVFTLCHVKPCTAVSAISLTPGAYKVSDSIASISCGFVVQQVVRLAVRLADCCMQLAVDLLWTCCATSCTTCCKTCSLFYNLL